MAEKISSLQSTRYAVVTGGNKGIGYETCKQLASKGVVVVLTARDEKRGIEAIQTLKKESNFSDEQILFHQLDVTDPTTISSLVDFINTKFGRLDILVNNAGIGGLMVEGDIIILKDLIEGDFVTISTENEDDGSGREKITEGIVTNYELTKLCIETNYYGAKRMIEAFIPLLRLSDSPRIVNVASFLGKLKKIMVMIKVPKRVFTKQQKDRVKAMIDNLIDLPLESDDEDDDLTIFVKHIVRINKLIQEVVWVGGLLSVEKKYVALRSALPNDFQKELLDKSWHKLGHRMSKSFKFLVQDFVMRTACGSYWLPIENKLSLDLRIDLSLSIPVHMKILQ